MKSLNLFKFVVIIVAISCATQTNDSDQIQTDSLDDEQIGPYPPIISDEISALDKPNPWNCGYEWIMIKGPNGETIISQIPLKCDPFADIYKGCPVPYKNIKQSK